MKKIFLFILIIISITIISCEKTVEVNIPHKPMITLMYGIFTKDNGQTYYLDGTVKESKKITEASANFANIFNASVLLYENGVQVDSLKADPFTFQFTGQYLSDKFNNFKGSKKYKLAVNASGYPPVYAEDTMPSKVPFTVSMVANSKTFVIPEYSSSPTLCDEINISFTDPASSKDYYAFDVFGTLFRTGYLIFDGDAEIDLPQNDPGSIEVLKYGTVYYQDKNFNGKQKTVQIFVPSQSTSSYKYVMNSSHISENLYKFQRSYNNYRTALEDPFSEPVLVHSNVVGGAGIFGLQQQSSDTLR